MKQQPRSQQQQSLAQELASRFDIDPDRILFLNPDKPEEPWLSAEALVTIARRSGEFQAIDEGFDQYISQLNQLVHRASVTDKEGRVYTRSGVSTIGERQDIDAHALAAGRAVGAALTAAGFNPLRPGAVVSISAHQQQSGAATSDEANSRNIDLKRIHALAEEKGLLRRGPGNTIERSGYRTFLLTHFNTTTAVSLDQTQRASLINLIEQLPADGEEEFAEVA
ncbi:MAG: hypothetical protein ABW007_27285 [Chitinophagaceae bacterium]